MEGGGGGASATKRLLLFAGENDCEQPLLEAGFQVTRVTKASKALSSVHKSGPFDVVVVSADLEPGLSVVKAAREEDNRTFVAVVSQAAGESASTRIRCTNAGGNMVTASLTDLLSVLSVIATQGPGIRRAKPEKNKATKEEKKGRKGAAGEELYECPTCGLGGLTALQLWTHHPMYHVNEPNVPTACPLCGNSRLHGRFPPHLFNEHAPPGVHTENHPDTSIYAFALVVCQRSDGKFLLVQEFCHSGFWLPGGRVDPGEDLVIAAVRETKEEAGIDVELTGILRWEWSPHNHPKKPYVRMRVIFYGKPRDEKQLPKSVPDYESMGAVWAHAQEVAPGSGLPLRGREPQEWFAYVAAGGQIYPLSLLRPEGSPPNI